MTNGFNIKIDQQYVLLKSIYHLRVDYNRYYHIWKEIVLQFKLLVVV